jgi:hypothetical protein
MTVKIDEYFRRVEASEKQYINEKTGIPTIIKTPAYYGRLLLSLGMTYTTAQPYEDGEYDDNINKFSHVLACARMSCEAEVVEGGAKGWYSDRIVSAILQRHHGYSEKTTLDVSGTIIHQMQPLSPEERVARLERAHQALLAVEVVAPVDAEYEELPSIAVDSSDA